MTTAATAASFCSLAKWTATAVSTMPSSMRSSVESRNAPNAVPLPDMREYAPSSVSMIEPTMNATPPQKNSVCQTSSAATTFSAKPVERDRVRRQPRLDQAVAVQRAALGARARPARRAGRWSSGICRRR